PASALRAARSVGDGAKAGHAVDDRAQNHARRPTLRSHFAGRAETGTGGRVLFVYVATRHGGAGDRHRLPIERVRRCRPVDLSARRVAFGIALVCEQRKSGRANEKSGGERSVDGVSRSEEHTSELQSPCNLVCRLLLEKKK